MQRNAICQSPRIAVAAPGDRILSEVDGPAVLDVPGLSHEGLGEALAADEEAAAVVGDVAAAEPAPGAHLMTHGCWTYFLHVPPAIGLIRTAPIVQPNW